MPQKGQDKQQHKKIRLNINVLIGIAAVALILYLIVVFTRF